VNREYPVRFAVEYPDRETCELMILFRQKYPR